MAAGFSHPGVTGGTRWADAPGGGVPDLFSGGAEVHRRGVRDTSVAGSEGRLRARGLARFLRRAAHRSAQRGADQEHHEARAEHVGRRAPESVVF